MMCGGVVVCGVDVVWIGMMWCGVVRYWFVWWVAYAQWYYILLASILKSPNFGKLPNIVYDLLYCQ